LILRAVELVGVSAEQVDVLAVSEIPREVKEVFVDEVSEISVGLIRIAVVTGALADRSGEVVRVIAAFIIAAHAEIERQPGGERDNPLEAAESASDLIALFHLVGIAQRIRAEQGQ
jgi:hypothetical protein